MIMHLGVSQILIINSKKYIFSADIWSGKYSQVELKNNRMDQVVISLDNFSDL